MVAVLKLQGRCLMVSLYIQNRAFVSVAKKEFVRNVMIWYQKDQNFNVKLTPILQLLFGANPSPNSRALLLLDIQILVSDLFGFWG